ncbi:uncharacterized protein LOC114580329 [Dendrobium catenatum]|uniref:uncharacterized protein LOC114580329 n=1 Tax=Dendrobium catenatum TaxID=906689 RepID=UPI00109F3C22|nr:uncharacterized protein LOC114580329 [Dendrobium catenatum]
MALKLDMEQAYDNMGWPALKQILCWYGFPSIYSSLILECVVNVRFSIIINGKYSKWMKACSGFRQGCPVSPYLYIMCSQLLSNSLRKKEGDIGIQISPRGPRISHLMYADDVLIFSQASKWLAKNLKKIVEEFCKWTGQSVNINKSQIIFGKNVNRQVKNKLTKVFGFKVVKELHYFGIKISLTKLKAADFQDLLVNAMERLNVWGKKSISLGGLDVSNSVPIIDLPIPPMSDAVFINLDGVLHMDLHIHDPVDHSDWIEEFIGNKCCVGNIEEADSQERKLLWESLEKGSWIVASVYGSTDSQECKLLWESLEKHCSVDLPMVVGGDFNCILSQDEKRGGRKFSMSQGSKDFQQFLNNSDLLEVKASDPRDIRYEEVWASYHGATALVRKIWNRKSVGKLDSLVSTLGGSKELNKVDGRRLEKVIHKIISVDQAAFVRGHSLSDHVLVAQEVFDKFKWSKSKAGLLAIKLDVEISRGISVSRLAHRVSHLLFADDILIFSEAKVKEVKEISYLGIKMALRRLRPSDFQNL